MYKQGSSMTKNICSVSTKNLESSFFKYQAQGLNVYGIKTVYKPDKILKIALKKCAPKHFQTKPN